MKLIQVRALECLFVLIQVVVSAWGQQSPQCETCSRDPSACREVKGTFGVTVMSKGYNPVVTIPEGACNINITEIDHSSNFLALKTTDGDYLFNGLWTIVSPGQYPGAGTTFTYDRGSDTCPGECIRSPGPNNVALVVQILYHHTNPGIDYSYQLPPNTEPITSEEVIEEHHKKHRHRHHKHERPLDQEEQLEIESLKAEVPSSSDSDQVTSQPTSRSHRRRGGSRESSAQRSRQHRRRRPIFSSDFSMSRRHGHHNAGTEQDSRQPTPDVSSSDRRQELKDVTYIRQIPDVTKVEGGRPDYTAGLESVSNRIDSPNPDGNPSSVNSSSEYSWRIAGFSECSRTCGEGVQETTVICVLSSSQTVPDINCDPSTRPAIQRVVCNSADCPTAWETGDWSACSVTCGAGQQTRRAVCRTPVTETQSVTVRDARCRGRKPATSQACQEGPCTQWTAAQWTACSVDCGEGVKRRQVSCRDGAWRVVNDSQCDQPKPTSMLSCDMGSCTRNWFFSRWTDQCSTDCGSGVMSRQVHCAGDDGEKLADDGCDVKKRPRTEKACRRDTPCGGKWFAGPWSECSVSCGQGVRIRDAVCVKRTPGGNLMIVSDENCLETDKPVVKEKCNQDDCGTQWYRTEWSSCSVTCGGGTKRRYVRCLDKDMVSSASCIEAEKPSQSMRCNTDKCWGQKPTSHGSRRCRDMFPNCRVVVQARLCRYPYYQTKCCSSCSKGYK